MPIAGPSGPLPKEQRIIFLFAKSVYLLLNLHNVLIPLASGQVLFCFFLKAIKKESSYSVLALEIVRKTHTDTNTNAYMLQEKYL